MKLTAEDGIEYEYKNGELIKIQKEWPQKGDKYWLFDGGWVRNLTCHNDALDIKMKKSGIYKTKEEAEYHRERVQSLQNLKHIGVVPDEDGTILIQLELDPEYYEAWKVLKDE